MKWECIFCNQTMFRLWTVKCSKRPTPALNIKPEMLMTLQLRYVRVCVYLLLCRILGYMLFIIMSLSLSWQSRQSRLPRLSHPQLRVRQLLQDQLQRQRLMQLLLQQCQGWWRPLPAWKPTEGCLESYPMDNALHLGSTPLHHLGGSVCTLWCTGNRTWLSEVRKTKKKPN